MIKKIVPTLITCSMLLVGTIAFATDIIKIGFNIPLTGKIPKVGESSKLAAEMLKSDINSAGGISVGKKRYLLEFIYEDNGAEAEKAVNVTSKLVKVDEVLAMIGPHSSRQAVPAGKVANDNQTIMISPWSVDPKTTLNRSWVFRAAFLDPNQGPVAVNFGIKKYNAKKAAVIYELSNDYSKDLAEIFRNHFEAKLGKNAVIAFEGHSSMDKNFRLEKNFYIQLRKVIKENPDFIFLPDNYHYVAIIVRIARKLGYTGPFIGTDTWGTHRLVPLCGDACKGFYFTTHYAAIGATGTTKNFIDRFTAKYGKIPDDVAALTWDATHVVLKAIQNAGDLKKELKENRKAIQKAMYAIKEFKGITGKMKFDKQGDPIKCIVVARISDMGAFEFAESMCP